MASMEALERFRIVLVAPQHPGNIGATARAMKVMGLAHLALVTPAHFPSTQADARASGATEILQAAQVCSTLDEAVADCQLVIGTSARSRHLSWPLQDVRSAAAQAAAGARQRQQVALVFGRERSGLSNAELDRCTLHLRIATNPQYASLNLAAAVQVVCHELRSAVAVADAAGAVHATAAQEMVTAADMEGLYGHWADVLTASGFLDPAEPKLLMRRLRRLMQRAAPDRTELNMLRGALRSLDPRRRR